MIKKFYKDPNLMADIFEFHDGSCYAIYWKQGNVLGKAGVPPEVLNATNGMQIVSQKFAHIIKKCGTKI